MITLLGDDAERFIQRELFRKPQIECDQHLTIARCFPDFGLWTLDFGLPPHRLPNQLRRLFSHWLSAFAAIKLGQVRPKQLHIIANLGHGTDARAGSFYTIALLNRNRWR